MTTVNIPDGSLFGINNLPYGVFSPEGRAPRVGVRVGNSVIDLAVALKDPVFAESTVNAFMAQGHRRWLAVRERITELVTGDIPTDAIFPLESVNLHLPMTVMDYVDFYASENHAVNLGQLFRPGSAPLMPNWKHMPVSYHGRSSTVVASGVDIVRPCGQRRNPGQENPDFGPSRRLDIEAEIGFVVGTPSKIGYSITPDRFSDHVFGAVVVNDWSARDIQAWESAPLGPHLGKSFATSVSPWIVPLLALEAARIGTPVRDPEPLLYLRGDENWWLDIDLEVVWNGHVVSRPPYAQMYWSPAQMLAHMTSNGACTRTGDLLASGTVSGSQKNQRGSFIELTWNGREPVVVGPATRTFLEDGDTVSISATAPGIGGSRIGFGDVSAHVVRAHVVRARR